MLNKLLLTVAIMVGAYLAVFLSYILIPVSVFLFIYFILHIVEEENKEG